MNNLNIIGTMTRDLELKYLPSGAAMGSFAIAVNQDYKNQDGTKVEKVSFFDVKVIGKQSEIINQFFSKGSRIAITGSLEQESWTAQDGTNKSKVIIKLEAFSFIDRKSENQSNNMQQPPKGGGEYINPRGIRQNNYQAKSIPEIDYDEDMNDEVPF